MARIMATFTTLGKSQCLPIIESPRSSSPWAVCITARPSCLPSSTARQSSLAHTGNCRYVVRCRVLLLICSPQRERIIVLIRCLGCSIWCVELIRREILRNHPDTQVNAILIDFFLYDTIKEREKNGEEGILAHHRTRSIWY